MSTPVEVKVPAVGESIHEVEIGRWLKKDGEHVDADETLVVLETDKAAVDLPAPVAGVVTRHAHEPGEKARIGEAIAWIEPGAGIVTAEKPAARAEPRRRPAAEPPPSPASDEMPWKSSPVEAVPDEIADTRASPSTRRLLAEHGLHAGEVATSEGGVITREDALRRIETQKPPENGVAPTDRVVPMSSVRRRIAERMVRAQRDAALLTTFNEADLGEVNALRARHRDAFLARHGVKLGLLSFFARATVTALAEFPALNAEVRGANLVFHDRIDLGVAVSTDRGLVVPVLRDAGAASFSGIERFVEDAARRARENRLLPDELTGGTFTITNGGVFGSLLSTPIVNPPQSGVLGLHAIQERPVARAGSVVIRPMMYLALTYDHRVVDGREAVTFLKRIRERIEDPASLLLET